MLEFFNLKGFGMGKFKVGDKVRRVKDVERFTRRTGKIYGKVTSVRSEGAICVNDIKSYYWDPDMFEIDFEPWSIYNNTKPLSELSDEQVGAICRHGIEKGVIEVRDDNGEWHDALVLVGWHTALAYRAKQKTERELFEEALIKVIGTELVSPLSISDILFDAGFKAPKVGE